MFVNTETSWKNRKKVSLWHYAMVWNKAEHEWHLSTLHDSLIGVLEIVQLSGLRHYTIWLRMKTNGGPKVNFLNTFFVKVRGISLAERFFQVVLFKRKLLLVFISYFSTVFTILHIYFHNIIYLFMCCIFILMPICINTFVFAQNEEIPGT